jgi:hypothetical protein
MTEQIMGPGDEGQQQEPEAIAQTSGQPSQQSDEPSSPWFVAPGAASPMGVPPEPTAIPGQPIWPGQGADFTGPGPGPWPTRTRRRNVIVIAAAAAIVLIGGGIALALALTSGGQRYPSTLVGLTRDDGPDAQQVAGQFTSEMGVLQGMIVHPGAAIFGVLPTDGLLLMTAQWSDAAKADGLVTDMSNSAMGGLKAQGVTDSAVFRAGPIGGSLACGDRNVGGQSGIICVWADRRMFGVAWYFGSASNLSDAAGKTNQVRSAIEH